MSKIKKHSLLFFISIIILILSRSTYVYADTDIGTILGENRDGWFCVQMNEDAASGAYKQIGKDKYWYSSNSSSQFERAIAYILRSAKNSGINPGLPITVLLPVDATIRMSPI